jgi:outer membrane protein insertion porin family
VAVSLLLPALLASGLLADAVAPPSEDLLGRTVTDVVVEGVDPGAVGPIAGVHGEPLTRGLVHELIEVLWATDRYRDVEVRTVAVADGVRLIVRLDARRRIRTMDAEGNDHLALAELRRVAGFVPDAEEHPDLLEDMRGRIEAAYAAHGYPNAVVSFRSEETAETGRVVLVAEIDEGEPIRVAEIRLAGTLLFPEHMLLGIVDVETGDPWDQPGLIDAAKRLAAFYRDQGFLLVWIPEPVATPDEGTGDRVNVVFDVDPGLPVRIVFGGNDSVSSAELAGIAAFDEASAFDAVELGNVADRLSTHYRTLGFPDAAVSWDVVAGQPTEPTPTTPFEDPAAWSTGVLTADPFGDLGGGGRTADAPPDSVWFVRFRVHEGPRLGVARIDWRGVSSFDEEELSDMVFENVDAAIDRPWIFQPFPPGELGGLGLSGEGWLAGPAGTDPFLSAWGPDRVYLEQAYRDAAIRVEEKYRSAGFLDAHVTVLAPLEDPVARTITPQFEVDEGVQSVLGSIALDGEEALEEEELRDVFLLEAGDPVNERLVEESRRALLDRYADNGYLFAQVERGIVFSEDRSFVELTFLITEGPQVRVGAIEVTGNSDTETSLVLGTLSFSVGDVFTPDAAQESERRLLRMGVFQGATIVPVAPDAVEAEKTISVQVREYLPQSLELRAGFSTAEGARATLEYGYRNLFGYAIGLHLRLKLNYQLFFLGNTTFEENFRRLSLQDQLERLLVASLSVPYLPGLGGLLVTQVDLTNERDNEPFYGLDRSSAFLTLSTGWRKLLSVSVRGGVEYNDVRRFEGDFPLCSGALPVGSVCMTPEDARRLRTPEGTSTFAVVRSTFAVDWRDDPFNPSQGLYFSAVGEWVRSFAPVWSAETGTSSFSNLIKTSFQLSGYAPLGAGLVLALSGRYGQIFQLQDGSRTFPDRYFYLGGSDTLRGFPQESLSVADAPPSFPSPGGDVFVVIRGELRIPLGDTFGVAVFSDIGNLWRDFTNIDLSDLRYTAGLGLRIQTPIGPLSFDYGVNIISRSDWNEGFGALHFSIGSF